MNSKERNRKIAASGVRKIFTPRSPVDNADLLAGRDDEIDLVVSTLGAPGGHCLLSGHKGIGKTSVATVAMEIAAEIDGLEFDGVRCDAGYAFADMVAPLLEKAGYDPGIVSTQTSTLSIGGGALNLGIANAKAKQQKSQTVTLAGARDWAHSPARVCRAVKHLKLIYLLDEIDQAPPEAIKTLAVLIKHLSDYISPLKILMGGAPKIIRTLKEGHSSVLRCTSSIELRQMPDAEIAQIVTNGAEKLNLKFAPAVIERIVSMSSGFPYFAHLIALELAERAITEDRKSIAERDLPDATEKAKRKAENELRDAYDGIVQQGYDKGREQAIRILCAAASIPNVATNTFGAQSWRNAYSDLWGEKIKDGVFNNYMSRIVSKNGDGVITRIGARGSTYKFNDPRMPSYIKLANMDNLPGNGQR